MKRFFSVFLCVALVFSLFTFSVFAQEKEDILLSREIETLENGDTITTELYLDAVQPLSGVSGHKTTTYRNAADKAMWDLTVYGSFTYTYGVSSTATSASAVVNIYDNNCTLVSKNAYTEDNTAIATAIVKYGLSVTPARVSVTCSIYGVLS